MKFLGISFAPLKIPIERRLQTLAVLYLHTSFFFFGIGGCLLALYLLFTPYYFLSLIYLTWFYYDFDVASEGGRTFDWARRSRLFRYYAAYFPIKLVKTADLDPSKNYIFGFHPHGIMVAGCFCNFGSEGTGFSNLFPGIRPRVLTLEGQFQVPLHRDALLASGACSVSRRSIEYLLQKCGVGNALVIVPGGAAEALDARPGFNTLTIKRRKGFVKMAMIHGASLVPVYSFGENDIYNQIPNPPGSLLRKFQDKMTKILGFSPPIFNGRGVFNYSIGYLPHRKPIVTVVGKPMELEKNPTPSPEELDKVHSEYLQRLTELYDQYKVKYGNPDLELTFT